MTLLWRKWVAMLISVSLLISRTFLLFFFLNLFCFKIHFIIRRCIHIIGYCCCNCCYILEIFILIKSWMSKVQETNKNRKQKKNKKIQNVSIPRVIGFLFFIYCFTCTCMSWLSDNVIQSKSANAEQKLLQLQPTTDLQPHTKCRAKNNNWAT
jgi:hypothetical protein